MVNILVTSVRNKRGRKTIINEIYLHNNRANFVFNANTTVIYEELLAEFGQLSYELVSTANHGLEFSNLLQRKFSDNYMYL